MPSNAFFAWLNSTEEKIQKLVDDSVVDEELAADRQEGQIERVESNWGVKRKRTKSRKMLFSSSETGKKILIYYVSKTGDCDQERSPLTVDDFSNVNKMRIKVLSSYPCGPL